MMSITSALLSLLFLINLSSSLRTCPSCGSVQVPYPLSTSAACGDPDYRLRCDPSERNLYLDTLNHSSYLVLAANLSTNRMVVRPSPWVPGTCTTQDLLTSEGLWLNQSLPFNVTNSNTIFLFNCSPRLLISPLNCTSTSLCHRYLDGLGRVERGRAGQCSRDASPCCTFVAGGLPSAYKIRLHSSGCRAFRSIVHLDPLKPTGEWEEGLEIQWAPPPEPVCRSQSDCPKDSTCSPSKEGISRCYCDKGYFWDRPLLSCFKTAHHPLSPATLPPLKIALPTLAFLVLAVAISALTIAKRPAKSSTQSKLIRARQDFLSATTGGKAARLFTMNEVKRATNAFSKDRFLGSGGFGEVYKGVLDDGTLVAVKSAKVGSIKSNQQVLNEVGILSQVNHKNLVNLLGCCIEPDQPLMIYEYIPNGTLHDHLHGMKFLPWKIRLNIALQTAEALAYLHSSAHTPIYHRDVKSTNILLDKDLNAKVADFGLSRLVRPGLTHVTTCAQGTLGYLDPEYYRNYQLTDKSDVYSYGVVLLELVTGQKAIDFAREEDDVNLAVYVVQRSEQGGGFEEVVEQGLVGEDAAADEAVKSIRMVLELALTCLREKKGERPTMKEVVQQLLYIQRN